MLLLSGHKKQIKKGWEVGSIERCIIGFYVLKKELEVSDSLSVQGMRRILGENRNKASSLEMSMINVGTMLERSRGNCEDAN